MYAKLDITSGTPIVRVWKNGILVVERTDFGTLTQASDELYRVAFNTNWNGSPEVAQAFRYDDVVVRTDQPGGTTHPDSKDVAGNWMIGL